MSMLLQSGTKEQLRRYQELASHKTPNADEAQIIHWAHVADPNAWLVGDFQHRRFLSLCAAARIIEEKNAEAPVPPFVIVVEHTGPKPQPEAVPSRERFRFAQLFSSFIPFSRGARA